MSALTIQQPTPGRVVLINFPGIGERAAVVGKAAGSVISAQIIAADVDDDAPDYVAGVDHDNAPADADTLAHDAPMSWRYPPRNNDTVTVQQ